MVVLWDIRKCMDAYNSKKVPQETPMARLCRKLTSQQRDKLVYLFNTAHSVAMHNWSLKDFKPCVNYRSRMMC